MFRLSFLVMFVVGMLSVSCAQKTPESLPEQAKTKSVDQTVVKTFEPPPDIMKQLPPAPAGLQWRLYHNAFFRIPVGWKEKETKAVDDMQIFAYAASPEDFSEKKFFEMGITVKAMFGVKTSQKIAANKFGLVYLNSIMQNRTKEDILYLDQKQINEKEQHLWLRYRDAANGQKPIVVHQYVITNDAADVLFVFMFESPEDTWEENWKKYGKAFLSITGYTQIEAVDK